MITIQNMEPNINHIETLEKSDLPKETLEIYYSEIQAAEEEKDDHLGVIIGTRDKPPKVS